VSGLTEEEIKSLWRAEQDALFFDQEQLKKINEKRKAAGKSTIGFYVLDRMDDGEVFATVIDAKGLRNDAESFLAFAGELKVSMMRLEDRSGSQRASKRHHSPQSATKSH
jgi:hypothetical protein